MKSYKEKISQSIIIPCTITVVESFEEKDTDGSTKGVKIKGKLIEAGVPTRNGVSYTAESLARFVDFFNKNKMTIPFLDSHDDSSIRKSPPFGHVEALSMEGNKVFYGADIDPEEKDFLRKLKRKDIREVSLQAIVDSVGEQEALDGGDSCIIADVKELLEISSVLIPGARGTSIEMEEQFGFMSEKRFAETFHNSKKNGITFKESHKLLLKEHYSTKEANDNASILGGNVTEPKEEDINTGNSSSLVGTGLPKKIKKIDEIIHKSNFLKITTRRIS